MNKEKFKLTLPVTDVCLLDKEVTIGSETFAPGRDKYYFTFTLLNSYPEINSNGATFAYPLLKRYIPTAVNSPIDLEHEIEGSPLYAGENRIIGAIVKADIAELDDDNELLPQEGQPVICIGVLWGRLSDVRAIVEDLSSGLEWKVSMEVDRDMDQDVFLVGSEVIDQASDEWDEVYGAWAQGKTYKDSKIGLALGGTGLEDDDYASFFGAGIVMNPADDKARIHDIQIAPVAATPTDPRQFIGIAVNQRASVGAKAKVVIESDGDLQSTSLQVGGQEITGFNVLNFSVEDLGDGYPYFNVDWSKFQTGKDGITEITHWYYDPTVGGIVQGKRSGGVMELKEIKKLIAESEEKFKGYMSPEELASAVASVKDEYEGYLSPEEHQKKLDEAIKNAFAEKELQDKTYAEREKALATAGLEVTEERQKKAREFPLTDEGTKEFENWVAILKTGQDDMATAMREAGIEVSDEVKKSIASLDGANDPRFKTAIAMNLAARGRVVNTPAGVVDGNGGKTNLSAI